MSTVESAKTFFVLREVAGVVASFQEVKGQASSRAVSPDGKYLVGGGYKETKVCAGWRPDSA
ncbi:MAG: hypothetical protein HKM02_01780 [Pseudomonadales bacterium]|nr:hypothetical protein [Pseudomonadales bacterium]